MVDRLDVLPELEAENVIMFRVLPCLVRMCKKEETTPNRIVAAETLAYLIEVRKYLPLRHNLCFTTQLTLIINKMHRSLSVWELLR